MPYADKEKQTNYTMDYNNNHKEAAAFNRDKSHFKRFVRDYADDTDLEWLNDLIRMKREGVKID